MPTDIEPTAEHFEEAHRIAPIDCPIGAITRIAHALAAREARGAKGSDDRALRMFYADNLGIDYTGDTVPCWDDILEAAEARGFERGQKANPAAVWGWAAAVGNGWLLCPMVRGDQLVVDVNDVRGMIFGEPGREGYAAVRRFVNREYSKRVRRKTMEGARSALSKLMGESIPALPDSKEPR